MDRLIALSELKEANPAHVGIIAAQRAKLLHAGLPIAPGFVITPQFFKDFLVENALHQHFFTVIKSSKDTKEVHEYLQNLKFPEELEEELHEACEVLGNNLAITTSAAFDDAVFAMYNTPMNKVTSGVKSCWASLFHESRKEWLNKKTLFPAILIQKDTKAKKSGTIYTHNPVSKSGSKMVIELQFPDQCSIAVRKDNGELVSLKGAKSSIPLTDSEKKQLVGLAKKIESWTKVPQKVDWVLGDDLYVLESRDITEEDSAYFFSQATSSGSSENSSDN